MNPPQFPSSYQPGRSHTIKCKLSCRYPIVNGPPLPSQSDLIRKEREEEMMKDRRGRTLRDTLARAYHFDMTTQASDDDDYNKPKKPLNKKDHAQLPVAVVDATDAKVDLPENERPHCALCTEYYKVEDVVLVARCGHVAHTSCFSPWFLDYSFYCPLCRHPQM